jgi:hypothetical protein
LILVFGSYIVMFGGIFAIIALVRPGQGGPPGPEVPIMIFSLIGVVVLGVMFVSFALHALFMFVFPLIVDRQLSGWEALKLSSRAVWANIGGVILLILLSTALSFLGVLACYVGAILEMPLMMGLTAVAYRKVFPEVDRLREFDEIEGESEALPAQDAAPSSTEYHDREPGRGV